MPLFHIEEREKAALIGNNGAGKTTLLRIIMEEIHADAGQVVLAKDKRIGYSPVSGCAGTPFCI